MEKPLTILKLFVSYAKQREAPNEGGGEDQAEMHASPWQLFWQQSARQITAVFEESCGKEPICKNSSPGQAQQEIELYETGCVGLV